MASTNILYDSVSTKGGEGLYSKLAATGKSLYYMLDGMASMVAGYLFVINNYLPMYICLGFNMIAVILSFRFKDIHIHKDNKKEHKGFRAYLKEYGNDLKTSFDFIKTSKRMKSLILFGATFNSFIAVITIYRKDLLTYINVPPEQFSMIFSTLTLIGGISIIMKKKIEKKFKNRTLTLIALVYIFTCIIIGVITKNADANIMPVILWLYAIQNIMTAIWWVLDYKYLKNFTEEDTRDKITFTYEFIVCIVSSIVLALGGMLLDKITVTDAFLISGLLWLAIMILVLDYMRKRFGLKPGEYSKKDIEFVEK